MCTLGRGRELIMTALVRRANVRLGKGKHLRSPVSRTWAVGHPSTYYGAVSIMCIEAMGLRSYIRGCLDSYNIG